MTGRRQRYGIIVALVLLLGLGSLHLPQAKALGFWYVTLDGMDSQDCRSPAAPCATVNAVLTKADFVAGDTVLVEWGTYRSSDERESFLFLDQAVTLIGGWDRSFTQRKHNSTFWAYRMTGLTVAPATSVTLEAVQVIGGFASHPFGEGKPSASKAGTEPSSQPAQGVWRTMEAAHSALPYGGIHNRGTLRMENSGAGGRDGFGILNEGTMVMVDSGAAGDGDSGIVNYGQLTMEAYSSVSNGFAPSCGGIANYGTLTMTEGVLLYNRAYEWVGGALCNLGEATIRDSAISFNDAYYPYEGIPAEAGGIYNYGALTLTNVLLAYNDTHGRGGGLYNLGQVWLFNSSVTHNLGDGGAGIMNLPTGQVTLTHSLVADNEPFTSDDAGVDCQGVIGSTGYNLIRSLAGCDFRATTGDLPGRDPLLFWRALPSFPGYARIYHPLLYHSPAINAGDPAGCRDERGNPLLTDQRGTPRWGPCDIGAYEWHPDFDPLHYTLLPLLHHTAP